jgi:hypothetical protein
LKINPRNISVFPNAFFKSAFLVFCVLCFISKMSSVLSCPCGLPYEDVNRHGLVGPGGVCTAFKRGSRTDFCGELLADHPHQQQPATGRIIL